MMYIGEYNENEMEEEAWGKAVEGRSQHQV